VRQRETLQNTSRPFACRILYGAQRGSGVFRFSGTALLLLVAGTGQSWNCYQISSRTIETYFLSAKFVTVTSLVSPDPPRPANPGPVGCLGRDTAAVIRQPLYGLRTLVRSERSGLAHTRMAFTAGGAHRTECETGFAFRICKALDADVSIVFSTY
jgi:hypothetical protein